MLLERLTQHETDPDSFDRTGNRTLRLSNVSEGPERMTNKKYTLATSAAAMAVISVPINAKAAFINTAHAKLVSTRT